MPGFKPHFLKNSKAVFNATILASALERSIPSDI